jgi:hypothetical protein
LVDPTVTRPEIREASAATAEAAVGLPLQSKEDTETPAVTARPGLPIAAMIGGAVLLFGLLKKGGRK